MNTRCCTLAQLPVGEKAYITAVDGESDMRRRLSELGFVPNTVVESLYHSAFGDPTAYKIRNTVIALRQCDAVSVLVEREKTL